MGRAAFGCLGRDDGTDEFLRSFRLLRELGRQEEPLGLDRRRCGMRGQGDFSKCPYIDIEGAIAAHMDNMRKIKSASK